MVWNGERLQKAQENKQVEFRKETARRFHSHFRYLKGKRSSLEWPIWFVSGNSLKYWSFLAWIISKKSTGSKDLLFLKFVYFNRKKQWDGLSFPRTSWKQAASTQLTSPNGQHIREPRRNTKKKASALLLFWAISFVYLSDRILNIVPYQVAAYSTVLKGTKHSLRLL